MFPQIWGIHIPHTIIKNLIDNSLLNDLLKLLVVLLGDLLIVFEAGFKL